MALSKTARSRDSEFKPYCAHEPRHVEESFLELLHRLDPLLEPRWNAIRKRWEIWRDGKYIMAVQTQSGEYCPLDNRIIQKLWLADSHRYRNRTDFIASLHYDDNRLTDLKRKEQDEFIRACHRDMMPFVKRRKSITLAGKD